MEAAIIILCAFIGYLLANNSNNKTNKNQDHENRN